MAWRLGIDIGGTFTDLVAVEPESGKLCLRKVPSTPGDLARAAVAGIEALCREVRPEAISFLAHGTTAGTNALIEGTGARTGLITTSGFRDVLEIGRQQRPSLYDLRVRKPLPLVPRRLRREVAERLRFDGHVMRPLNLSAVEHELAALAEAGIESLAICLLHSYANPAHERAVLQLAERVLPNVYVTASCDILPRFREYERLMTTVVNAYLGPLMDRYLGELSRTLGRAGVAAPLHIMQSNGGLAAAEEACRKPASTVLSGPAGGAAAAAELCAKAGLERAIAIDMGGTSTDVCLIEGGMPASAAGREVGGYRVQLPGVDVRCVGAGGGSILWVDAGGRPHMGPWSAGADPGPVCYGRGGEEPTLTDALLALGRLGPSGLLGGEMPLDLEAARRAVSERVGGAIGLSLEHTALGAAALAVAAVRRAVEGVTVAQGRDPREFSLVAAGGAGPLIACELAAEMDVREVLVPPSPGNFSAWGLLTTDLRRDWAKTHFVSAGEERLAELAAGFEELEGEARRWVAEGGEQVNPVAVLRRAAVRYLGQDYELEVEVPPGPLTESDLEQVAAAFHRTHEGRYGYALPDREIEFVDLIVTVMREEPGTAAPSPGRASTGEAETGARPVFIGEEEGYLDCPIYDRGALGVGERVEGPAIVQQYDSTTYLPPRHRAYVEEDGSIRITRVAGP